MNMRDDTRTAFTRGILASRTLSGTLAWRTLSPATFDQGSTWARSTVLAMLTTFALAVAFIVSGLFSVFPVGASAAPDADDSGSYDAGLRLTLAAAVQRALDEAPSLTLVRFDVEEATIELQEAELGQLIGRPRNEYEHALRTVQDARDAYVDELVQVALATEEAYYDVLSTGEALVIQRSNQEQAERQFALTEARYTAGLIARQDFLEAELSYEQSLHSLEAAHRRHDNARRELNRLIGLDGATSVVLRDEFPFEPWQIELDVAVSEAVSGRAEIARAKRDVEQARLQVQQADTPYVAPVELHQAEMGLRRAEIRLEQAINQIETQVRTEWFALLDLRRNVDVAARQEQLALTRVEISRTRYDAGTIALLELLGHEEAYAQGRQDAVSAVWDYNLARARFLRTLGRSELPPLPETIAQYMESWDTD